jgi:GxxExxY protein
MAMTELLFKDEVYAIVGAAMEVYNVLGPGFLEAVYQEATEAEAVLRRLPFEPQKELVVYYKGQALHAVYKPDLIFYGKVVVELKALDRLTGREEAQLLNYLKATGMEVGVLINFGAPGKLEWKRMVLSRK